MSNFKDLSEAQSKLIYGKINQTEKNISLIINIFEGVIKKESKFCNKIDEIANKLKYTSDSEKTSDASLSKIYEHMSHTMVHLADIKTTKIERIEERLLSDLMQCDAVCRNTRDQAKNLIALRDFEFHKRSQINLNKNSRKNILTENEVMLSNIQISKVLKELISMAEKFENQRFIDIKGIFLNFILIQMKYFVSGIEILTTAYEDIAGINENSGQFVLEMKKYNKHYKKHIEQDTLQSHRFPFISRFSHSTSNVDLLGKHDSNKRNSKKNQSTMSLNSLDSNRPEEILHKKNFPIDLSLMEKISNSDETDIDESSEMEPTDTENIPNKP